MPNVTALDISIGGAFPTGWQRMDTRLVGSCNLLTASSVMSVTELPLSNRARTSFVAAEVRMCSLAVGSRLGSLTSQEALTVSLDMWSKV